MARRACSATTTSSSTTPGWFAEPGEDIVQSLAPDQVPSAENPGGENFYPLGARGRRRVDRRRQQHPGRGGAARELLQRRRRLCAKTSPTFPILQFSEGSVYSNRMHGYTVSTWEYATWDAENWWVEQG